MYLQLDGIVGQATFGYERYLNQLLYHSAEWKALRPRLIVRDNGCDMAMAGHDIPGRIYIHHLNPVTIADLRLKRPCLLDPENLVCVSFDTHNAITYGDERLLATIPTIVERAPGDTCPWKRGR